MKLPRLSRFLSPAQEAPRRGDRFLLWALLAFLAALLAGFLLFLPVEPLARQLLRQVERESGLQLAAAPARLSFPPGIALDRLAITLPDPNLPPLVLEELRLQPLWSSLVSADPGVRVSAKLLGGELHGAFRKSGAGEADLAGVGLDDLPLSPQLSLRLSLREGSLHWQGELPPAADRQGELTLRAGSLQLSGLAALGAGRDLLQGGRLELAASSRGSSVQIETLNLSGGELEAAGNGTLQLGPTPASSRLGLRLTLKPTAGLDPNLRDLLGLLAQPARDGSINLRLSGSLAAPQLR